MRDELKQEKKLAAKISLQIELTVAQYNLHSGTATMSVLFN